MPNEIVTEDGYLLVNTFSGSNGVWVLIGTESTSDKRGSAKECIDEFKNEALGKYKKIVRSDLYDMAEDKKIY